MSGEVGTGGIPPSTSETGDGAPNLPPKVTTPQESPKDSFSSKLQELKLLKEIAKLKKKLKKKKIKESSSSSSSSSDESDASSDEDVKKRKKGNKNKEAKQSYNFTTFNYDSLPSNNAFVTVPLGKPP